MARNCLVVDLDRCIGCYSCITSCKMENDTDLGENWCQVRQVEPFGEFPNVKTYWLPTMCQQCEDAPCVNVCPTGASYREEGSDIVLIDQDACIGCQLCISACPYNVRVYNVTTQVVGKCTLCAERRAEGEDPACVHNCCGKARFFGDLDDPESPAALAIVNAEEGAVHYLHDEGNGPRSAYILSAKNGEWQDDTTLEARAGKYVSVEASLTF